MEKTKASDLFVACLEEEGAEHIFAVPGEENLDLLESLRESRIRLVVCRHEQHAAFMAATYGRLTGRAGVCLATLGPGATNLLTGIAHAQLGGMPLVALTGQKPVRDNLQGKFQLVDVVGTFRPLTKWNTSVPSARTIPRILRHAFKVAEDERPGAVHVELPEDVASETTDAVPQRRARVRRPLPDPKAVAAAAERIRSAANPLLIVSAGANRKRIGDELAKFLDATGIYAVSTQMGKGVVSDDHPRSLFSLGIHQRDYVHHAIDAADLVVTVGYNIVEYPPSVWNERLDKTIVHVDFSLAEPDEFYSPALEVIGDISHSLRAIRKKLEGTPPFDDEDTKRLRAHIHEKLHLEQCEPCFPPKPSLVVREVRETMGREDVVCLDNGIYKLWFARMYQTFEENTLLLDNALATMGAGLASAMAAKMVRPDRRVLAVCGDGGFLMNSQDLETAVRLGLDLVVLVLRDDAYGFIRWKQEAMGFDDFGMSFGNPDFVAYARAYGASGRRLTASRRLRDVLREAFAEKGPVLVECPIDYSENATLGRDLAGEVRRLLSETS